MGFFNAEASVVVTLPIFSNSKIMITISKFEYGPKPGDNMLKYTGRIGCSALTDLVQKMFLRYICPKVLDHSVTLYIDISLIFKGRS